MPSYVRTSAVHGSRPFGALAGCVRPCDYDATVEATQKPAVSVVIPCYNVSNVIETQLAALSSQADAPTFEVVVVDNRSADDLESAVSAYIDRFPGGLRVVQAFEHQGSSYARNVGARFARANLLMFCDADDVVSQWWISQGVRAFESSELWSGAAVTINGALSMASVEQIRQSFDDSPLWEPMSTSQRNLTFPILMGGNFGCTRAAFERLGGFDQSFPTSGDDNDFAFRAHRAGLLVPIAPSVRIGYLGRTDRTTFPTQARSGFKAAKSHALLAARYNSWSESAFHPPLEGLARCVLAAGRMLVRPASRDWRNLGLRTAECSGLAWGFLRFELLKRMPETQIGLGLFEPHQPEGSNLDP